jgi:hypothetical protein
MKKILITLFLLVVITILLLPVENNSSCCDLPCDEPCFENVQPLLFSLLNIDINY